MPSDPIPNVELVLGEEYEGHGTHGEKLHGVLVSDGRFPRLKVSTIGFGTVECPVRLASLRRVSPPIPEDVARLISEARKHVPGAVVSVGIDDRYGSFTAVWSGSGGGYCVTLGAEFTGEHGKALLGGQGIISRDNLAENVRAGQAWPIDDARRMAGIDEAQKCPEPIFYGVMPAKLPKRLPPGVTVMHGMYTLLGSAELRNTTYIGRWRFTDKSVEQGEGGFSPHEIDWSTVPIQPDEKPEALTPLAFNGIQFPALPPFTEPLGQTPASSSVYTDPAGNVYDLGKYAITGEHVTVGEEQDRARRVARIGENLDREGVDRYGIARGDVRLMRDRGIRHEPQAQRVAAAKAAHLADLDRPSRDIRNVLGGTWEPEKGWRK